MKGLVLAAAFALLCAFLVTLLFLTVGLRNRASAMTRVFLGTVPLFVAAYAWTPPALWVLSPRLAEPRPLLELAFGLFVYTALFFGGLLQVYNLADRGFSLRIVMDIAESPGGALSHAELLRGYGGGRGLAWMLDRRSDDLRQHGFIAVVDGRCLNTPKGSRVAQVYGFLRAFLRLDGPPR